MIILRGNESQVLPGRTGMPQAQYAGEGAALATAGKDVANVANYATATAVRLGDEQALDQARREAHSTQSNLTLAADKYMNEDWIPNHVQTGKTPKDSIQTFSDWFDTQQPQYGDTSKNPYFAPAIKDAYDHVKTQTLLKAREYANKAYIETGKQITSEQLDQDTTLALLAESYGDVEGYNVQAQRTLSYLDSLKGTRYNAAEVAKLKQDFTRNLATKRAYQVVARDPAGFLTAHANGEYQRLDSKDAKGLVDAAEQSLARKVTIQDHQDRKQLEQVNEQRTVLKNSAISQALTDPAGALAAVNNPTIRTFMGPEYDNTVATIRAMAVDRGIDDPNVYRTVKSEIEQHPSPAMYKTLDKAMQNGTLRTGTYGTLMSRLTERLDKGKDHTETERQKLIRQGITTRRGMMQVTGIMNFDSASNQSMGLFDLEASQTLNDNPKLPVDETLDKLFIKHRQLTMDSFTSAAEGVIERHGLKSEADALERYKQGIMSRLESDEAIWYFQQGSKQKPSTPTTASSSNVKKKGLF